MHTSSSLGAIVVKTLHMIYRQVFHSLGWVKHVVLTTNHPGFISINKFLPADYAKHETFGGYYDKSLVNGKYVITLIANSPTNEVPDNSKPICLVVLNLNEKKIIYRKEVYSYNWQQGCRAHWVNDKTIIYNNFDKDNKTYYSELVDISTAKIINTYSSPVQDTYNNEFFLSINYERLNALRPDYGYRNKPLMSKDELEELKTDGIWKVDMQTGEKQMLINLENIKNFGNDPLSQAEKIHKANHVMISPDGQNIIFIHRFYPKGKRYDRLILAKISGEMIGVLATKFVSHYCWIDNNTIFGFFNNPEGKACYNMVNITTKKFTHANIPRFTSSGDGHPSSNNGFIVTDSYPDKYGYQHLLEYDYKNALAKEIASFYHPLKYKGESRCDLHPRISNDKIITLDSVDNGIRNMYISIDKMKL